MNPSHSIIEPIVNRNFFNTFQHQNGPNQRQHTHKNNSQQQQHINTSQQKQHRNTSQQYQHINNSQQYQKISFQRPRTSSISYLKEKFIGCGLNNKGVREFLIQHDGTLDNFPFVIPLYIREKAYREQILPNNHKHGSQPKYFN